MIVALHASIAGLPINDRSSGSRFSEVTSTALSEFSAFLIPSLGFHRHNKAALLQLPWPLQPGSLMSMSFGTVSVMGPIATFEALGVERE